MAILEILGDPQPGACFSIEDAPVVIGRDPFCDIVVEVRGVSRRHACISRTGDEYFIEDLNSLNGTFLNGERILGAVPLNDKDELTIHVVRCRFRNLALARPVSNTDQQESHAPARKDSLSRPAPPLPQPRVQHVQTQRRFQTQHETSQKLEAVLSVTRTLGSSLQMEKVLAGVLDGVFSVFTQASRGHVLFVDSPHSTPRIRATKQGGTDTICSAEPGTADFEIVRDVMETGEAILSVDEVDDAERESVLDFPLRSMMCVPLIGPRRKLIGLLYVDADDSDEPFNEDDLDVLIGIAGIAGRIIDYSLEHERMLAQAKELASERAGREQAESQIQSAQDIQQTLYPKAAPRLAGFDIAGKVFPAEQTCGDYFDFILQDDGSLLIVVADVSGHGLGPAIHAIETRAYIRAVSEVEPDLARLLVRVNRLLSDNEESHSFVTMFMARLDPRTREFTYAGAGHNAHLLHASGEWETLQSTALVLRLMRDEYHVVTDKRSLEPGDLLLIATDGFAEATSPQMELFGMRRVLDYFQQNQQLSASDLIDSVQRVIVDFQERATLSDDMTAVVVKSLSQD